MELNIGSFVSCAWISCLALEKMNSLVKIDQELIQSSKLIAEFNRLLIEAHSNLASIAVDGLNLSLDQSILQSQRVAGARECLNLVNVIRSSTRKNDENTIKLLNKVSRPWESRALRYKLTCFWL